MSTNTNTNLPVINFDEETYFGGVKELVYAVRQLQSINPHHNQIPHDPDQENGTGYFDGYATAVFEDRPIGTILWTVDGQQRLVVIVVGQVRKGAGNNIVLFQRFASKKDSVVATNVGDLYRPFVTGSGLSADEVCSVLGNFSRRNLVMQLDHFANQYNKD